MAKGKRRAFTKEFKAPRIPPRPPEDCYGEP